MAASRSDRDRFRRLYIKLTHYPGSGTLEHTLFPLRCKETRVAGQEDRTVALVMAHLQAQCAVTVSF
jgi:hypothetical protein